MKLLKNILVWLFLSGYLIIAMGFANTRHEKILCNEINVIIADSLQNNFVNRERVVSVFEREEKEILGYPLTKINTKELEKLLNNHWSIKTAEVYTKINGTLYVEVVQRKPLLRVIDHKRESYYIDEDGVIMPLSDNYTSHVLVANGNIKSPGKLLHQNKNIAVATDTINYKTLGELYQIAKYIHNNPFWNAQFVQIYVNDKQEFELIPRVGAHIILLGTVEDYTEKFDKLKTLYTKGLNNVGWNDYHQINLKYKNQVICNKK